MWGKREVGSTWLPWIESWGVGGAQGIVSRARAGFRERVPGASRHGRKVPWAWRVVGSESPGSRRLGRGLGEPLPGVPLPASRPSSYLGAAPRAGGARSAGGGPGSCPRQGGGGASGRGREGGAVAGLGPGGHPAALHRPPRGSRHRPRRIPPSRGTRASARPPPARLRCPFWRPSVTPAQPHRPAQEPKSQSHIASQTLKAEPHISS